MTAFDHPAESFLPIDPVPSGDEGAPEAVPSRVEGEAAAPAPAPPLDYIALAARILASPAMAALTAKRIDQAVRHGHTPEADRARSPHQLAREALLRLRDAVELLDGRPAPPDRLARALLKVEAAGAILLAVHDRIGADLGSRRGAERAEEREEG